MKEIRIRRSVRSFCDREVDDATVADLLRAGMAAPSAVNQQPWEFMVIRDEGDRNYIAGMGPISGSAAAAPVDILMLSRTYDLQLPELVYLDMSMCAQNIMLEAVHLGLGSVFLTVVPYPERIDYIARRFSLPSTVSPFGVIALGYPSWDRLNHEADRFHEDRIHWGTY